MPFELKTIEALAPDQASLAAASKLAKASQWVRLEQDGALLWGECKGSGANPYRVVVDASDQGYKCTCPSRKFPCKHSLALMWLTLVGADSFKMASPPEWVTDWLGRRRKTASPPPVQGEGKNIQIATLPETPSEEDEAKVAKRKAARKNAPRTPNSPLPKRSMSWSNGSPIRCAWG